MRRLLLLAFVTCAACAPPAWEERAVQVRWDPDGVDFWDLPMPSDLRRGDDGSAGFAGWPDADRDEMVQMWLTEADRRTLDGYGVGSGVTLTFNSMIDDESLPEDGLGSLADDATVFLLDVDPESPFRGERIPLRVRYTVAATRFSPSHLLTAMPVFGFVRRPDTRYALVLTEGLDDWSGEPVGRSRAFHDWWEGIEPNDVFDSTRETLELVGVDPDTVLGAAVFTTFDPDATLRRLAAWTERQPTPTLVYDWNHHRSYESFESFTSRYTVPVIQSGERNYEEPGEGRIVWDGDDAVIQSTQDVRLALTVPHGPMPPDGWPLTIYLHGSGGSWLQAIYRGPRAEEPDAPPPPPGTGPAEWLARRGVATLGFDLPLHGDRGDPPDDLGLAFYNILGNIDATVENFHVAVMELLLLSRMMTEMSIDPEGLPMEPGDAADGLVRFDPDRLTAKGQSLGSSIGIPWAGVDPRLDGAVWSGAGGTLVEVAVEAVEPVPFAPVLAGRLGLELEELTQAHPLLHAFQTVWDLVDPVAKGRRVFAEPRPGMPPRPTLMIAGFRDGYFSPASQAALAVSLGVPLAGPEVEPELPAALQLAGIDPADYPAQGNLDGVTAAVDQYAAPHTLGHYVTFNQEGARHQYTCFLATVGQPGGPVVVEPGGLDDPCE